MENDSHPNLFEIKPEIIRFALSCLPKFSWWAEQMSYLDAFFIETHGRFEPQIVAAELSMLDTMYAVGLWRRNPRAMVERLCKIGPLIENWLNGILDADFHNLNEDHFPLLEKCHSKCARDENKTTEGEVVASAKYLHFCFPKLFPILDKKVGVLVGIIKENDSWKRDSYRKLLTYYKNILKCNPDLCGQNCSEWKVNTTVRTIDAILWLIALARDWEETGKTTSMNSEIRAFFKQDEKNAKNLLP